MNEQDSPQPAETSAPKAETPAKAAKDAKDAKDATPPTPAIPATPAADVPAAPPAPEAPAPSVTRPARKPQKGQWWWGLGRRKTAVARVRIRPGDGTFLINKRPYNEYLTEERDQKNLMTVLSKTNTTGALDVHVNVCGGGFTGQAGAIVMGLGRALLKYDDTLEPILRSNGFLRRDPRMVERKKYGQPGARARFQFSKR